MFAFALEFAIFVNTFFVRNPPMLVSMEKLTKNSGHHENILKKETECYTWKKNDDETQQTIHLHTTHKYMKMKMHIYLVCSLGE